MRYFQVIVPPLPHCLTYVIPKEVISEPAIGQRVLVPIKNKYVTGYLWEEAKEISEDQELKEVSELLDPQPLFPPSLKPFLEWIARYYLAPLGLVLKTALPAGLTVKSISSFAFTPDGRESIKSQALTKEEKVLLDRLSITSRIKRKFSNKEQNILIDWEARGWVETVSRIQREQARPKKEKWIFPGSNLEKLSLTPKQKALLKSLLEEIPIAFSRFMKDFKVSSGRLEYLQKKGLIEIKEQVCLRDPLGELLTLEQEPIQLTPEQGKALSEIQTRLLSDQYQAVLVHGVTGSGKTEIYLRAVEEVLQKDKEALILVPEIGLIPQMEGRFRLRFGGRIALLHSGLSPGERLDQWRKIQMGAASVVIGTRSAVFAPFSSIGLIIVDEEHDSSYKQTESLRYNARDLALVRGQMSGALVVLGSATPSVSSLYLRRQRKVAYSGLYQRVQQQSLPEITIVDMKKFRRSRQISIFSPSLEEAIRQNKEQGQQTLLFLNRRGFDTLILCTLCGTAMKCRNCSVTLTYHAREDRLRCHTCGYQTAMPRLCPSCRQEGLKALGLGTEKVEKELLKLFPDAAVDRMDRDTVTRKRAHFEILKKIRDRQTDILIGTQMITKGHDFPHITLIGVVCADLSLNWPDYRAGERTFQLLAQVAGRAGRGDHPGKVIIQTYNPDHYLYKYLLKHDYLGFFAQEIRLRREFKYPPFSRLINVLFQGNREAQVRQVAEEAAERLREELEKGSGRSTLEVLGPVPAPIEKIKGKFRYHLLLKGEDTRVVHQAGTYIQQVEKQWVKGKGVQIILDVDPVDML